MTLIIKDLDERVRVFEDLMVVMDLVFGSDSDEDNFSAKL